MHPVTSSLLPLWSFPCFDPATLRVAITTRRGGVSTGSFASLNIGFHVGDEYDDVLTNRIRTAEAFGVDLDDCIFAEQVAGTRITRVGDPERGRGARSKADALPQADGLVTTEPGPVLALMAADCMLIAMHDPAAPALALVHAGWPGTVNGAIPAAVRAMLECGAKPDRIVTAIAPAVSAGTYQVGDDVAQAALSAFGPRVGEVLRPDGTGRYVFDLVGAAHIQLVDAGLKVASIFDSGQTTGPGTDFFSHRFEGPTGRFALLAQLSGKAAA
ncbi:MAG: polyphenol oxidase family protein [Nakamurella sp.]